MGDGVPLSLVNLEFNSSCNLRCRWCALDHAKPRRVMTPEILAKVLDDLRDPLFAGLRRLDLHNGGETLLHPDLPAMLAVLATKKNALPSGAVVALLTNAMLLSPRKSVQIIASRAVTQMRFSLDGGTPALFESIRQGAKWAIVRRNVAAFCEANEAAGHPMATEAICLIEPEGLPGGFDPEFAALLARLDKISPRHPHNWDGSKELGVDDTSYREIAGDRHGEVCFLLERNLVVLPDGRVTVCCNDLNGRGVIGSVLESSLAELAAGPKRQAMLAAFRDTGCRGVPLCRSCSGFYTAPRTPS
jgi:sulfatase maturation enzyme AslB (radical SAM superfamily)